MLRVLEDLLRIALFDDLAAVHHDHALRTLCGKPQIVRDQQHGRAELTRHRTDLIEDRLLHGDVQRAGRLVRDQQARLAGETDRDQRALSHAAGELVRILLGALRRVGQTCGLERLDDLRGDVLPVGEAVREQRLGDLRADLRDRIEVRHRVLRHEPDVASADRAHLVLRSLRDLPTVETDAAGGDASATGEEADDRHRGRRLARPGLPHDRDGLALGDLEVDALDGVHDAVGGVEVDGQAFDRQQRSAHLRFLGDIGHLSAPSSSGPSTLSALHRTA